MTEHKAKHEIQPGICPMCNKALSQGDPEIQEQYTWTDVSCPSCNWQGRQWDRIQFDGFTVYDENGETVNVEPADGKHCAHGLCAKHAEQQRRDRHREMLMKIEAGVMMV